MATQGIPTPGRFVDAERLILRQRHMDTIGMTPGGGVHRLALSAEDIEARRTLVDWARPRGFDVRIDRVANLFITRPGRQADAAPVLIGSHTDSQPYAGRFDGMYGVLAAFEALEAIDDAGLETRRPMTAVVWTGEEGGARFPVGTVGSAAFTRRRSLEVTLALQDRAGITLEQAVAAHAEALPGIALRQLGGPVHAFVEIHIEQGQVLERARIPIGAVTAIQGMRKFAIEVIGEEAHSGTTPRAFRKDALQDAMSLISDMRDACLDPDDAVRFTVGFFEVHPNAPAVVPGRVRFVVDLRHPQHAKLDRLTEAFLRRCQEHPGPCRVVFEEIVRADPVEFTRIMPELVETSAQLLSIPSMRLISGANHDAGHLATVCPLTTMIFIPCKGGVSHNEAEHAQDEDLVSGARVLCQTAFELAQS